MQLGTRWTSGEEPPAKLPEQFRTEIAAVEASLSKDQLGQPAPRWTLTWLEGRPVAELDTGVIVTMNAEGRAIARNDPDDGFG